MSLNKNKMQKRSFFQKLTGSYPFEEDEVMEDETGIGTKDVKKIIPKHVDDEEDEEIIEEEPEEEGQLTIDVFQNKDSIIIQTMVAGVKPENLEISITREMVTIRGHREETESRNEDDYFFRELYWGNFSRTIVLPQEIEPEEATATEKHGLLTLTLPKINKEKMAKVKVKSV